MFIRAGKNKKELLKVCTQVLTMCLRKIAAIHPCGWEGSFSKNAQKSLNAVQVRKQETAQHNHVIFNTLNTRRVC